jgi:hypothetical protein
MARQPGVHVVVGRRTSLPATSSTPPRCRPSFVE